jgi:hypothetical protein
VSAEREEHHHADDARSGKHVGKGVPQHDQQHRDSAQQIDALNAGAAHRAASIASTISV